MREIFLGISDSESPDEKAYKILNLVVYYCELPKIGKPDSRWITGTLARITNAAVRALLLYHVDFGRRQ